MIKIAIFGAQGKMGKRIAEFALADTDICVNVALERPGHPDCGTKIGDVILTDDIAKLEDADVVIDFSGARGTMALLPEALKYKKAMVIGSTGLDATQIMQIEKAASQIPVVFAPNMSVGVNLLFRLVEQAAAKLKGYNIRIKEAHHIHKKDAPSGTAKKIAQIIQEQTNEIVEDIEAIREGEIIGDHEITFDSDLDTLVLSHHAKTRNIFAKAAVDTAKWLIGKPAGLYSMQDVLGR